MTAERRAALDQTERENMWNIFVTTLQEESLLKELVDAARRRRADHRRAHSGDGIVSLTASFLIAVYTLRAELLARAETPVRD